MKNRVFKAPDDLWDAAMAKATQQGESLGEVLRSALRRYVGGTMKRNDPDLPSPVITEITAPTDAGTVESTPGLRRNVKTGLATLAIALGVAALAAPAATASPLSPYGGADSGGWTYAGTVNGHEHCWQLSSNDGTHAAFKCADGSRFIIGQSG